MNKKMQAATMIAAVSVSILASREASATIITQYSFSGTTVAPVNSVTATTGDALDIGTPLGMTNNYTLSGGQTSSTTYCDILPTAGTAHTTFSESTWRIRGNTLPGGATSGNGWSNSAPNYTQGAEFVADTTGYIPTTLTFDWYSTTQGVANLQVRYSLDGTNFTNLASDLIATSNDYYGGAGASPTNTVDLSSISALAANDPNFTIELVSVKPVLGDSDYSLTGPGGDGNYASASGDTSAATAVDYNNNSGNWRFDNITVSGTAVPEPASLAGIGLAGMALAARRRKA
jgi:hypothetical protein